MVVKRDAVIDETGKYRYVLTREFDSGDPFKIVSFVMFNPSTADALKDDATIRKCTGFTQRYFGAKTMKVYNLFALRSRDPGEVLRAEDPVGPENNTYLCKASLSLETLVVAWGAIALPRQHHDRVAYVYSLLTQYKKLYCFGKTGNGQPRHPLMLSYTTPLEEFRLL